jgi:hypothetical protein
MRFPAAICLISACSVPEPTADPAFLREAVLLPASATHSATAPRTDRRVGFGRVLRDLAWTPGGAVDIDGRTYTAPLAAECLPLFSVDLGDARAAVVAEATPDAALAFDPTADRLAVGTFRGEVRLVDAWTGATLATRKLSESLVKQVAWSGDGHTLYAAEQSPDALVHALDPATLTSRWTYRLADEVGSSPLPPPTDPYGLYTLPAAYSLDVLPGGDLVVLATHGWNEGGSRRNRSRVVRLDGNGRPKAFWPASGAADATFLTSRVSLDGERVAVSLHRSADGPPPDLPIGDIVVLDTQSLTFVDAVHTEPLRPYFDAALVWGGLDVARDRVIAAYQDGRLRIVRLDGTAPIEVALATPIPSGPAPISASVGWARLRGEDVVSITSHTNIPWGAAAPDARPPAPHPRANTVWSHGLDGTLRWTYHGEEDLQGLSISPGGRFAAVGAGPRQTDDRRDRFGALLFRADGDGDGQQRLVARCPTDGPAFFRHAVTDDGRVALIELPLRAADGSVSGDYRLTVLR